MRRRGNSTKRERGSSLVEFIFCAPILLIISGATVDISNYLRHTQVTNFVSHQAADLVYRRCSDITVYNRPTLSSTTLSINRDSTLNAVTACSGSIQNTMQGLLNSTLPGAIAMTTTLRYDLALQSTGACDASAIGISQPHVASSALIESKTTEEGDDGSGHGQDDNHDSTQNERENELELDDEGGVKLNGSSVISLDEACLRQKIVAVEVSFPYTPVVKFLPNFLTLDPGNKGKHRETTIF